MDLRITDNLITDILKHYRYCLVNCSNRFLQKNCVNVYQSLHVYVNIYSGIFCYLLNSDFYL